jgi:hypothetical protein
MTKKWRVSWARNVARIGQKNTAYRISVGRPEEKTIEVSKV